VSNNGFKNFSVFMVSVFVDILPRNDHSLLFLNDEEYF